MNILSQLPDVTTVLGALMQQTQGAQSTPQDPNQPVQQDQVPAQQDASNGAENTTAAPVVDTDVPKSMPATPPNSAQTVSPQVASNLQAILVQKNVEQSLPPKPVSNQGVAVQTTQDVKVANAYDMQIVTYAKPEEAQKPVQYSYIIDLEKKGGKRVEVKIKSNARRDEKSSIKDKKIKKKDHHHHHSHHHGHKKAGHKHK